MLAGSRASTTVNLSSDYAYANTETITSIGMHPGLRLGWNKLYLQYPRCVHSGQGRLRPPGPLWDETVHTSHSGYGQ